VIAKADDSGVTWKTPVPVTVCAGNAITGAGTKAKITKRKMI